MKGNHMKIEQVVFNLDDPDQVQLHQHLSRRKNKSGYLKRLIQRDLDGTFGILTDFISRSSPSTELDFVAEAFI